MSTTTISRVIDAPVERVFRTVSDIGNFRQAVPDIVKVEFLTDQHHGVGTRFRETRMMGGREASTVLEVKELVENDRIRLVSDAGGTVWDSVFTTKPVDGGVELTLTMDAKAYRLSARLLNPLLRGMIRKAVAKDMDAVKAYCEQGGGAAEAASPDA